MFRSSEKVFVVPRSMVNVVNPVPVWERVPVAFCAEALSVARSEKRASVTIRTNFEVVFMVMLFGLGCGCYFCSEAELMSILFFSTFFSFKNDPIPPREVAIIGPANPDCR